MRPIPTSQLDYAATDSHFLFHIAMKQLQVLVKEGKKSFMDIQTWYRKLNQKVMASTYRTNASNHDPNESYRKSFRKDMDYFDPQSDVYLLT